MTSLKLDKIVTALDDPSTNIGAASCIQTRRMCVFLFLRLRATPAANHPKRLEPRAMTCSWLGLVVVTILIGLYPVYQIVITRDSAVCSLSVSEM